ncbi:MAG: YitT family protein [Bacteroidales bacterium]|nr:YitT family protein [Bacteroidales bacterium]MDD3665968.1 YitT family protein [Bacteroidales bacterium]
MAFIPSERTFSAQWFKDYLLVVSGAFLLALAYVLFINPYHVVPGGIYGLGIIIHHITREMPLGFDGIPVGLAGLLLNIPLTFFGIRILGPRFGVRTVIGFIATSVFMDGMTLLINQPDPLGLSNDVFLACLFGGALSGAGLGLIFKSRAASGGSDVIAMIISKFTKQPLGILVICIDSVIVLLGLVVFADWRTPLYSWIVIFISGMVIDLVLEGFRHEKSVMIVSDKYQEIRDIIINDLHRSGTFLEAKGMYNGRDRVVIHTVLNRRELAILKDGIKAIDARAFLTVTDAGEILGNGFKSLNDKISD